MFLENVSFFFPEVIFWAMDQWQIKFTNPLPADGAKTLHGKRRPTSIFPIPHVQLSHLRQGFSFQSHSSDAHRPRSSRTQGRQVGMIFELFRVTVLKNYHLVCNPQYIGIFFSFCLQRFTPLSIATFIHLSALGALGFSLPVDRPAETLVDAGSHPGPQQEA